MNDKTHHLTSDSSLPTKLLKWYQSEGEKHPWRLTTNPYHILVSEIMLQQTTVTAVKKNQRYERFLEQFPDLKSLAVSAESDLLRAWEGLGYYRRVRNLQKTAQAILQDHSGHFPTTREELLALPGIGPYTASALIAFAWNQPAPLIDANIQRVFARLLNLRSDPSTAKNTRYLEETILALAPSAESRLARDFHSATMELGQKICRSSHPACHQCPIKVHCLAPDPENLPIKKPRPKPIKITEHAILLTKNIAHTPHILLSKELQRRSGFWKLPLRPTAQLTNHPILSTHTYTITKYRVTLHLHHIPHETPPANFPNNADAIEEFFPLDKLDTIPLVSPVRKLLKSPALSTILQHRHNTPTVS